MIDPREVSVGNWVIRITWKDDKAPSLFEYRAITADEHYYAFAKFCFPIKITTSVLGRIGFKHEFGDWYINRPAEGIDGGLPFLRYRHSDGCWYLAKTKLSWQPLYIHQLQNLFYVLSNAELNIRREHFETGAMVAAGFFAKAPNTHFQIGQTLKNYFGESVNYATLSRNDVVIEP